MKTDAVTRVGVGGQNLTVVLEELSDSQGAAETAENTSCFMNAMARTRENASIPTKTRSSESRISIAVKYNPV